MDIPELEHDNSDDVMAALLATGMTPKDVAARLNIHINTVYRRLKDKTFKVIVRGFQDHMVEEILGAAIVASRECVATYQELMKSEDTKIRLAATNSLRDMLLRVRENHHIAREIEELRDQVEQS